ncbi:MAG: hypothetical protein ACYDHP_10200 [Ferrimicrobium sp.]
MTISDEAAPTLKKNAPIDTQALLDEELRRLRHSGTISPSYLHRIDALLSEMEPPLVSLDTETHLRRFEQASFFDIDVPTASRKPGVALVKKTIRRGISWYLNYLTQQLNNASGELINTLDRLNIRLNEVEGRLDQIVPINALNGLVNRLPTSALATAALSDALDHITSEAPILITDADDDGLLVGAPENRYGVTLNESVADQLCAQGCDVRVASLEHHLERIAPGSLASMVLRGTELEFSPTWLKHRLLAVAHDAIASGGVLHLLHHDPEILALDPALGAAASLRSAPLPEPAWRELLASTEWTDRHTTRIAADTWITTARA